ncbi:adenosylmethionine--8-amino-7-oxononanoate transaminase [Pajaroellobacter abortibovis]|uniref:Adenosylmethionine-8-amino-7-oxononanoate aminotransferase n=1 Tax=Pajaroellobacter abortibovis TaxID=1882918 RepID=A0A1L6MX42_9BACT|nr:adenosylmethionine--8-amino-7-oxononanoate transaminase [Pajaroellobacter abortibovis]APS00104.1 adenosylmethionine--8-amino-7-oxononanoate transaminase [Pajaroellobacter abortibovis]
MKREDIVRLDKQYIWHPYTCMYHYLEEGDPLVIKRAHGIWLEDVNGQRYIDGTSSWWMAALGHSHPRLLKVLETQSSKLAHCPLGGVTHEPAAALAADLIHVAPQGLTRVFYTDNGSTAIEAAVKMAIQMWRYEGAPQKTRFVSLSSAFHGETLGATSLGGCELFRKPFANVLFECLYTPPPDEHNYAQAFDVLEQLIQREASTLAAVVVEPIVQGAAGMRIYSPSYLQALRTLCDRFNVLLIADEVFTGYGRTGPMWACEHASICPDIMCIGKPLAGLLPMGATLANHRVFRAFSQENGETLYYGHTFCGHPLGAALAREVLAIFRDEKILEQIKQKETLIATSMQRLQSQKGVKQTRSIGMIGAADLESTLEQEEKGYLSPLGKSVHREALQRGVYLRPLGSTVFICPPLIISTSELTTLLTIFEDSIASTIASL